MHRDISVREATLCFEVRGEGSEIPELHAGHADLLAKLGELERQHGGRLLPHGRGKHHRINLSGIQWRIERQGSKVANAVDTMADDAALADEQILARLRIACGPIHLLR
jgi:hypothetical protein